MKIEWSCHKLSDTEIISGAFDKGYHYKPKPGNVSFQGEN